MEIKDIMKQDVVTVEKGTLVMDAVKKLAAHNITGLPVVDDKNRIMGIISEKDVLALAVRIHEKTYDSKTEELRVEDFMTKEVVTVEAIESLTALCSCLMKSQFRRVPVVLKGKLVGIVSRKDVIEYILDIES